MSVPQSQQIFSQPKLEAIRKLIYIAAIVIARVSSIVVTCKHTVSKNLVALVISVQDLTPLMIERQEVVVGQIEVRSQAHCIRGVHPPYISLHVPLVNGTEHLIGKELFDEIPDHLVFINSARGGVVVEQEMIDAIDSGKISYAYLDVLTDEYSRCQYSSSTSFAGCKSRPL